MPPSYGHGHADALSFMLQADGRDVFIDPGTYTYTGDPDWRRYFRSTEAHNTVTVNNSDQSRQDGCFMWSNPVSSRLIAVETDDGVCGRMLADHDGYSASGIRHCRGIAWSRNEWLLVWDGLFGADVNSLDLHWHVAMQPRWIDNQTFDLQDGEIRLRIQCLGGIATTHSGERSPLLGWRAPSYGSTAPIWTIRLHSEASLPHSFTTIIGLQGQLPAKEAIESSLKWIRQEAH
jgi:uncharacterized heparinase superfamily protein